MSHLYKFTKDKNKIEWDLAIIMLLLRKELKLLHAGLKPRRKDGINKKLILILGLVLMTSNLCNHYIIISLLLVLLVKHWDLWIKEKELFCMNKQFVEARKLWKIMLVLKLVKWIVEFFQKKIHHLPWLMINLMKSMNISIKQHLDLELI